VRADGKEQKVAAAAAAEAVRAGLEEARPGSRAEENMNVRRLLRLADETHLPMRASAGKRGLYENLEGFREPRVSLRPRRVPRDEMLEGSGRANKAQRVKLMGRDAARMTTPCLASSARSFAHIFSHIL
jgi:hypothetical protein